MPDDFKLALKETLFLLPGYWCIGIGCGVIFTRNTALDVFWNAAVSLLSFSGSTQMVQSVFIGQQTALYIALPVIFFMNIRYAVYGISLLNVFQSYGAVKWFLIFTLSDELYALYLSRSDLKRNVHVWMAVLGLGYWVTGGIIGGLARQSLPERWSGVDFAMTAIFAAILTEQCRQKCNRLPALAGAISAVLGYWIAGARGMLILSMAIMTLILWCLRKPLEKTNHE